MFLYNNNTSDIFYDSCDYYKISKLQYKLYSVVYNNYVTAYNTHKQRLEHLPPGEKYNLIKIWCDESKRLMIKYSVIKKFCSANIYNYSISKYGQIFNKCLDYIKCDYHLRFSISSKIFNNRHNKY